ncbi:MAG: thioredoxin family protein [Bacteroidota bacterium]|nr:thioredoxin family protein [Bacteroidota bacterium]
MKKIQLLIFSVLILMSCGTSNELNRTLTDKTNNRTIIYGQCDKKIFTHKEFSTWYNYSYDSYYAGAAEVNRLKNYTDELTEIKIILGSWCSDSRREVPRFLKIMETVDFPDNKITIYGVDRKMKSDVKAISTIGFTRVPTFIFYKGKKEVGRIIERPEMTLEEDLLLILSRNYEK